MLVSHLLTFHWSSHKAKFKAKSWGSSFHHTEDMAEVEKYNSITAGSEELITIIQSTTIPIHNFLFLPTRSAYSGVCQTNRHIYIQTQRERERETHISLKMLSIIFISYFIIYNKLF